MPIEDAHDRQKPKPPKMRPPYPAQKPKKKVVVKKPPPIPVPDLAAPYDPTYAKPKPVSRPTMMDKPSKGKKIRIRATKSGVVRMSLEDWAAWNLLGDKGLSEQDKKSINQYNRKLERIESNQKRRAELVRNTPYHKLADLLGPGQSREDFIKNGKRQQGFQFGPYVNAAAKFGIGKIPEIDDFVDNIPGKIKDIPLTDREWKDFFDKAGRQGGSVADFLRDDQLFEWGKTGYFGLNKAAEALAIKSQEVLSERTPEQLEEDRQAIREALEDDFARDWVIGPAASKWLEGGPLTKMAAAELAMLFGPGIGVLPAKPLIGAVRAAIMAGKNLPKGARVAAEAARQGYRVSSPIPGAHGVKARKLKPALADETGELNLDTFLDRTEKRWLDPLDNGVTGTMTPAAKNVVMRKLQKQIMSAKPRWWKEKNAGKYLRQREMTQRKLDASDVLLMNRLAKKLKIEEIYAIRALASGVDAPERAAWHIDQATHWTEDPLERYSHAVHADLNNAAARYVEKVSDDPYDGVRLRADAPQELKDLWDVYKRAYETREQIYQDLDVLLEETIQGRIQAPGMIMKGAQWIENETWIRLQIAQNPKLLEAGEVMDELVATGKMTEQQKWDNLQLIQAQARAYLDRATQQRKADVRRLEKQYNKLKNQVLEEADDEAEEAIAEKLYNLAEQLEEIAVERVVDGETRWVPLPIDSDEYFRQLTGTHYGFLQRSLEAYAADNLGIPVEKIQYVKGGAWADDLAMDEAKTAIAWGRKTKGTKNYLPQGFKTAKTFVRLVKELTDMTIEGLPYAKNWYKDSGAAILRHSGGDIDMADRLAALTAIYSPQQSVTPNIGLALRAHEQFLTARKVTLGSPHQQRYAEAVMRGEDWREGIKPDQAIKIRNFYGNLLKHIDRDRMVERGYAGNEVTADGWMAAAFKYGKNTDTVSINPQQARMIERVTQRIADELGIEPEEAQAAIWTSIKASNDSKLNIYPREEALRRAGTHFETGLARTEHQLRIAFEAASDNIPEYKDWSPEVQQSFLIATAKAVRDAFHANGLYSHLGDFGIGTSVRPDSTQVNPAAAIFVNVGNLSKGDFVLGQESADFANALAAIVGKNLLQDTSGWMRPMVSTSEATHTMFHVDAPGVSKDVLFKLANSLKDIGYITQTPDGFAFVRHDPETLLDNITKGADKPVKKRVLDAVEEALGSDAVATIRGSSHRGGYLEGPQQYESAIARAGSSDLLRSLDSDLASEAGRVREAYIRDPEGANAALRGSVEEVQQAAAAGPDIPGVPARPGTTPLPPGYLRVYHYSPADADTLRAEGLRMDLAKGNRYGEPNAIWGSASYPKAAEEQQNIVEFMVKYDDPRWDIGAYSPGVKYGEAGEQTPEAWARWMEDKGQHVTFKDNIAPDEIIAVHEPWHEHLRYYIENNVDPETIKWLDDSGPAYYPYKRALDEYRKLIDTDLRAAGTNPEFPRGYDRAVRETHVTLEDRLKKQDQWIPQPGKSHLLGGLATTETLTFAGIPMRRTRIEISPNLGDAEIVAHEFWHYLENMDLKTAKKLKKLLGDEGEDVVSAWETWLVMGGRGPKEMNDVFGRLSDTVAAGLGARGTPVSNRPQLPRRVIDIFDAVHDWQNIQGYGLHGPEHTAGVAKEPFPRGLPLPWHKDFKSFRKNMQVVLSPSGRRAIGKLWSDQTTTKEFRGRGLATGLFKADVIKAAATEITKALKLASAVRVRNILLQVSDARPRTNAAWAIKVNPDKKVSPDLARYYDLTSELGENVDVAHLIANQPLPPGQKGGLKPNKIFGKDQLQEIENAEIEAFWKGMFPEGEDIDRLRAALLSGDEEAIERLRAELPPEVLGEIDNIRWVEPHLIKDDLFDPPNLRKMRMDAMGKLARVGTLTVDILNDFMRVALLYANPSYYPLNLMGNLVMNATQQGVFMPLNLGLAFAAHDRLPFGYAELIDNLMGKGFTTVLEFRSLGKPSSVFSDFANMLVDRVPRRAAWIHEARRLNYKTGDDIAGLLAAAKGGNQEAIDDVMFITQQAKHEIVDFDNMSHIERDLISRMIFVYPWFRGATAYTVKLPFNHPVQAAAYAALYERQQSMAQETVGDRPGYMDLFIPLGEVERFGEEYPYGINLRQAFTPSTPYDLAQAAWGWFHGDTSTTPLSEFLQPIYSMAIANITGYDPFLDKKVDRGFLPLVTSAFKSITTETPLWQGKERIMRSDEEREQAANEKEALYPRNFYDDILRTALGTFLTGPVNPKEAQERAREGKAATPEQKMEDWTIAFTEKVGKPPPPDVVAIKAGKIRYEEIQKEVLKKMGSTKLGAYGVALSRFWLLNELQNKPRDENAEEELKKLPNDALKRFADTIARMLGWESERYQFLNKVVEGEDE